MGERRWGKRDGRKETGERRQNKGVRRSYLTNLALII